MSSAMYVVHWKVLSTGKSKENNLKNENDSQQARIGNIKLNLDPIYQIIQLTIYNLFEIDLKI